MIAADSLFDKLMQWSPENALTDSSTRKAVESGTVVGEQNDCHVQV